jgi:alpha-mannosidase
VTVATDGAITSLIDKQRGNREFERTINGRAMNDLGAGSGTLQVENAGPVSVTLLASSNSPLVHTSRITLIRDSDRIDIRNDINQNFNTTNTWAFGFNIDSPDVNHEEVGAIAHARLDTQGGNYSSRTRNARYDWLTLNHFADVSSGNVGITLSNADIDFMKLGNSTVSSLDTTTPQISALAGGRVVDGTKGLPNQGGDTHFLQRFALKTHDAYDPVLSMRFALEHQNPFVTGLVTGGTTYPETGYSLVDIPDQNVFLWAIKPAEEGIDQGVIARVWNVSPASRNFTLLFADVSVTCAKQTSHIETDIQDEFFAGNTLSSSVVGQQIKTYRLLNTSIYPVMLNTVPEPTLQKAFNDVASDTDIIKIRLGEYDFLEVIYNKPHSIILKGRYESTFQEDTGFPTTIVGALTIQDGSVTMENIAIK